MLLAIAPSVAATDMELLRAQVVAYYTAEGADISAPLVVEALAALELRTEEVTAEGFLLGDGSWADIDYGEVPSGAWSPWEHFRRLTVMAKAYKTAGQRFHEDATLLAMIEESLTYLDTFYGPNEKTPGNWWFWSIGPSLDLGPTLVMVAADVRPSVRESATRVLEGRIGKRPGVTNESVTLTGQNRIWSSMNHMMLAILRDDTDRMSQVRNLLSLEIVPLPVGVDGLKSDYSFHQHGPQLYTGGYGGSFAYDVSRYLLFTRGTSWAPSEIIDRHIFNFIADGIAWSLYQNYFDASVIGREVAYVTASGFNGIAALLHASLVESERLAEIRAAAAMMLKTWDGPLKTELAAIAVTVGEATASWPSGMKHYPDSDHTIHRRPGWYASVRMFSRRTLSGESINDENLVGSRQSDGYLYLVTAGDEYFANDVRPTLDWGRLSGITVEQWPLSANDDFGRGRSDFVGAATNGRTGSAAMELTPIESELTARKAWIFFEDSIVFLTDGVSCLTGRPAETVVDQRPARSGEPLVIDGKPFTGRSTSGDFRWAAGDGVGYWFPGPEVISVREETRFGSWVSLARSNPQGSVSNRIRAIWFDHGANVTNGTAEYVIVPDIDAAGMEAWVEAAPVTILSNNFQAAAARDERTGELGIVFWRPGTIEGIQVDRASIIHKTDVGDTVTLAVADPARAATKIRVTIPESLRLVSGSAIVRLETGTTTIDIPVSRGRTSTIVLSRTFRTRAVRR